MLYITCKVLTNAFTVSAFVLLFSPVFVILWMWILGRARLISEYHFVSSESLCDWYRFCIPLELSSDPRIKYLKERLCGYVSLYGGKQTKMSLVTLKYRHYSKNCFSDGCLPKVSLPSTDGFDNIAIHRNAHWFSICNELSIIEKVLKTVNGGQRPAEL